MLKKQLLRQKRKKSIRKKISGTTSIPRVSMFRSNKHIYAQVIDDSNHITLSSVSSAIEKAKDNKVNIASALGTKLAAQLKEKKIDAIVFDRSGYKYHGRVKAFADSLRESGIKF